MPRISILVFAHFAQALAQSFDWEKRVEQETRGHNGEFSNYLRRYAQSYSSGRQKYSEKDFVDRTAQATKSEPAAGQATLLVAAPAIEQNASDPVAEAQAAKQRASQHAEARIEDLRNWNAKLKQDIESKNLSVKMAQGILTEVQTSYVSKREELERSFSAAVEALDPKTLAEANSSEVKQAEDAVKHIMEEIKHLDHAQARAMRSTLDSLEKADKAKARAIWKEAREAAHHVYGSGMAAARAQRKAGVHERIYERAELDTEQASEGLLGQAEEAAERAEGLVERHFGKVEHHLEKMMDDLKVDALDAREARRLRFHQAKDRVHEARRAAHAKAAQQGPAQNESANQHMANPKAAQQEPTQKEPIKKELVPEKPMQKEPTRKEPAHEKSPQKEVAQTEPAQKDLVQHAKQATQQPVAGKEPTKQESTKQEPSRDEEKAGSTSFLAARVLQDDGANLLAPLACAFAAGAASAVLAARSCGRAVHMQNPLLG